MNKTQLVFDPAQTADSDAVGAYLRASDGTLLTHTDVGGKKSLDVNVANTVDVTATDLDIRNLSSATDSVAVTDGGGSLTVDATALDIRPLTNADVVTVEDGGGSITVDGSVGITGTVAVTQSTNPWVVSATDLDVRDLSHTQDSIKIGDGTDFLAINADGSINVTGTFSVNPADNKAEDAAHVSGDVGSYILSVREDTLATSTSATGDYQSVKTDALGRVWMNETTQTMAHSAVSVTTTATNLIASPLANRKRVVILNNDNKNVYIGGASVTTSNGLKLSPGVSGEFLVGPGVALYGITATGTSDVRIMELA